MEKRICPQCKSPEMEYFPEDNSYVCKVCGNMQVGDGPVVHTITNNFSENRLEQTQKRTVFNSRKYEKVSCPQCGSTNLTYVTESNTYRCPYCDNVFLRNDDITNNITNNFKKQNTIYEVRKPMSWAVRRKWIIFFELIMWFSYIGLFTYVILNLGPIITECEIFSDAFESVFIRKVSAVLLAFTLVIITMTHVVCAEKWTGHIVTGLLFGIYILAFVAPSVGQNQCFYYIVGYFLTILLGFILGRTITKMLGGDNK